MKIRIGLVVYLLFTLISCKTVYPSATVNYLSGNEQTLTVRSVGIGKNEEEAISNAEQNVFDVLLFRGLPESNQKITLIGSDEHSEKIKHKNYFDQFYEGKRYKTFIMSSLPVSNLTKTKSGKMISVDVKVNLSALRNDLESFGVIRKFGY